MAGEGNTRNATSVAANEAVVGGGGYGASTGLRGGIAGRRENSARESSVVGGDTGGLKASGVDHKPSGVEDKEGGREAARVAENPRGYSQGVRGGVKSPQGIDTPIAAELPRGYETPGVITESKRVPGYDRRGWGGDRNPPTNRLTKAQGDGGSDGKKLGGLRTAPRPQKAQRRTPTAWGPCQGIPPAPTAPGPSMAR